MPSSISEELALANRPETTIAQWVILQKFAHFFDKFRELKKVKKVKKWS